MVIPEHGTTERIDHPNPEEAAESDFKCNFMRMMESFKEEMKIPLKEMEEKINENGRNR